MKALYGAASAQMGRCRTVAPIPQGVESMPRPPPPLLVKSSPAPLASPGASTSPGHCSQLPGQQRVGWNQHPGLQWLEVEACEVQSLGQPAPLPIPNLARLAHLARPHNSRPLSSQTVWLWEASGLLKGQHKADLQVCPPRLMEMV